MGLGMELGRGWIWNEHGARQRPEYGAADGADHRVIHGPRNE